jgi:hypothetical protein
MNGRNRGSSFTFKANTLPAHLALVSRSAEAIGYKPIHRPAHIALGGTERFDILAGYKLRQRGVNLGEEDFELLAIFLPGSE